MSGFDDSRTSRYEKTAGLRQFLIQISPEWWRPPTDEGRRGGRRAGVAMTLG